MNSDAWEILAEPFAVGEVQWRVEALSKDKRRAMVVPYIDARSVLERLDEAVGPEGWQDTYEVLVAREGSFAVRCRLSVLGVSKEDVGEGESLKAAFSDALKRAAVKFGVGRYLYRLEKQWVDHDPDSGRFTPPQLERPAQPLRAGHAEAQEALAEAEKPEPQELIDRLIDRLKEMGMGKEVARIVMKYQGYGKSLDETRQLYGELRGLLKGKS
ncbi:Rad52/Rad22 family DNA repair protein [Calidithermus timidus]|jgi:hypothetical protein|uniref:Rad52/Rad22 family DNA repair protein n=1 Tax=Calidithermus timidus TaxID=307124 RepID=UPI00035D02DA|nr:Rad52/Rad22 family DNA repair protein [Calidithermus timidus]